MAFFRHFYSLRLSAPDITGCISFRLVPKVSGDLISMAVTRKMEDFRHDWVYVDVGWGDEALLELPTERPKKIAAAWSSSRLRGGRGDAARHGASRPPEAEGPHGADGGGGVPVA